jgi:alpha-galactosidase
VDRATSSTAGQTSTTVPAHDVPAFRITGGKPAPSTTSRIRGTGSGRCVNVEDQGTTNGTTLILWTCHGQSNQSWTRA